MKSAKNTRLIELLKARNLTIESLATLAFCGPKSVIQILRGQRVGTPTWQKLKRVMSVEELVCAIEFANVSLEHGNRKLELVKDRVVARKINPEDPVKLAIGKPEPVECST